MSADQVISHRPASRPFEAVLDEARRRIVAAGDLPHVPVAEQLALLDELVTFELGRFLLVHQGLNGYWTHYVAYLHPRQRGAGGSASATALERALLDRSPTLLATQERFDHFRRLVGEELSHRAGEPLSLASVPCGLMADLLTLDYGAARDVHLAGFDLDEESLALAARHAAERGRSVELSREDAWALSARDRFDVLVSNGLNLYEPDDQRVLALYERFAAALKPGGLLVTSFLTPPSEWIVSRIDPEALRLQRIVFADIIGARWQCFRTSETSRAQLARAGFTDIELVPDRANLFPTIVGRTGSD
jgi:SAM-dependent methyltransferase